MIELTAGAATAVVDPHYGGRVTSLRVAGLELLMGPVAERTDPLAWGLYPMAPFAGRVRGGRFSFRGASYQLEQNLGPHAAHGTVFTRPWSVEYQDGPYLRLTCGLGPGWPFQGWALQELALRPEGLDLRLEIHAATGAFPAIAGWHPWFRRRLTVGGPVELTIPAQRWYPKGEDGLPLGHVEAPPRNGSFDDCFTGLRWPVRLRWPGALEVAVVSTADHLVVFDQLQDAVAIEPQTGPPDGFNLSIATVVRPGVPLVTESGVAWRPDLGDPRHGPSVVVERRRTDRPERRRVTAENDAPP